MNIASKTWLAAAAFLTVLYFVGPHSPESRLFLFSGTGLLATLVITTSLWKNGGEDRAAWTLIAAGLGSFVLADVAYYVLERQAGLTGPTFPSIADVFYLAMYPLVIAGLTLLSRSRSANPDHAATRVAALAGIAAFAFMFVMFGDFFWSGGSGLARLVSLSYPVLGSLIIAAGVRLAVSSGSNDPSIMLVIASVTSLSVADLLYNVALNNGTYTHGGSADFFWLAFYVCLAAAALVRTAGTPETGDASSDLVSDVVSSKAVPTPVG